MTSHDPGALFSLPKAQSRVTYSYRAVRNRGLLSCPWKGWQQCDALQLGGSRLRLIGMRGRGPGCFFPSTLLRTGFFYLQHRQPGFTGRAQSVFGAVTWAVGWVVLAAAHGCVGCVTCDSSPASHDFSCPGRCQLQYQLPFRPALQLGLALLSGIACSTCRLTWLNPEACIHTEMGLPSSPFFFSSSAHPPSD